MHHYVGAWNGKGFFILILEEVSLIYLTPSYLFNPVLSYCLFAHPQLLPQDCEDTILDCEGGKCSCLDMVPFNTWESRGTCVAKNLGENNTKEGKVDDKDKKKKSGDAKQVKPKLNNDRIRFPTDVALEKEKEEFFSIKKLEY